MQNAIPRRDVLASIALIGSATATSPVLSLGASRTGRNPHPDYSPLDFGKGWVYNVRGTEFATANMHSLYLQTLVEAGIFGGIFMIMALVYVMYAGRRMLRTIRDYGIRLPVAYLAVGYVVAILPTASSKREQPGEARSTR